MTNPVWFVDAAQAKFPLKPLLLAKATTDEAVVTAQLVPRADAQAPDRTILLVVDDGIIVWKVEAQGTNVPLAYMQGPTGEPADGAAVIEPAEVNAPESGTL